MCFKAKSKQSNLLNVGLQTIDVQNRRALLIQEI